MDFKNSSEIDRRTQARHRNLHRLKWALLSFAFLGISACFLTIMLKQTTKESPSTKMLKCGKSSDCADSTSGRTQIAPQAQEQCKEICTTRECLAAASTMLSRMDLTVDPCNDFHSFTCGHRSENSYIINNDYTVTDYFLLTSQLYTKLLRLVENVHVEDNSTEDNISSKRKKIFDSCLKYMRQNDMDTQDIRTWFNNAGLSEWPHLSENWSLSSRAFNRILGHFLSVDGNALLKLRVYRKGTPEIFRPFHETLELYTKNNYVEFMPKQEQECEPDDLEINRNLSVILLQSLGTTEEFANEVIDDMFEVYEVVKNASEYERKEEAFNCSNPEDDVNNRWCVLLLQQMEHSNVKLNFSITEMKLVRADWFEFLDEFLNEYPQRKIVNYLALRFILSVINGLRSKLNPSLQNNLFPFDSCSRPPTMRKEVKEICLDWMNQNIHFIMTFDYIVENNLLAYMEKADTLLAHVKKAGQKLVETGTAFREEIDLNSMLRELEFDTKIHVGFYGREYDEKKILNQLRVSNTFVSNVIAVMKLKMDEILMFPENEVLMHFKRTGFFSMGASNGYVMIIKLGFIQPPSLGLNRPWYLDFGCMGMIMAHETAHNIQEDLPNVTEGVWKDDFVCLTEQYSKYEIPELGIPIKGNYTVMENLADVLGVRLAYKAYLSYLDESGDEPSLPGLTFTEKQMFFIALSQNLCELGDKAGFERYIYETHSPGLVRIHGSLQNSEDFSAAFNCPKGSPMNPLKKCKFNF